MPEIIAYATTLVAPDKTASEIEEMLRKHGCDKVAKEYESGRIKAIFFQINTVQGNMPFTLPVNVNAVYTLMLAQKQAMRRYAYSLPSE